MERARFLHQPNTAAISPTYTHHRPPHTHTHAAAAHPSVSAMNTTCCPNEEDAVKLVEDLVVEQMKQGQPLGSFVERALVRASGAEGGA